MQLSLILEILLLYIFKQSCLCSINHQDCDKFWRDIVRTNYFKNYLKKLHSLSYVYWVKAWLNQMY